LFLGNTRAETRSDKPLAFPSQAHCSLTEGQQEFYNLHFIGFEPGPFLRS
jgi:hypothetical protein